MWIYIVVTFMTIAVALKIITQNIFMQINSVDLSTGWLLLFKLAEMYTRLFLLFI